MVRGAKYGGGNRKKAKGQHRFVVTFLLFRDSLGVDARETTFHELYSRYAADVYRFARWLTGNPDDAQDITSETFVRAWTAPEEPRMETVKAYGTCSPSLETSTVNNGVASRAWRLWMKRCPIRPLSPMKPPFIRTNPVEP